MTLFHLLYLRTRFTTVFNTLHIFGVPMFYVYFAAEAFSSFVLMLMTKGQTAAGDVSTSGLCFLYFTPWLLSVFFLSHTHFITVLSVNMSSCDLWFICRADVSAEADVLHVAGPECQSNSFCF